jgi:hypothetical protein
VSTSTAELTLVLKAQNLAKGAIADVKTAIGGIETSAKNAGAALSTAFAGKGRQIGQELGSLTTNILNGQDFTAAGLQLGATLAGGLVSAFGEKVITYLAGTALVASIGGALSAAGASIGGLVAAAIPVGMAALPFLLVAAVVAAIAFLITHPEVVGEIAKVAGSIVGGIIGGLAGLAGMILGAIVAAPGVIASVVGGFVGGIVDWFLKIPGKLVDLGASIVKAIVGGLVSLPGKIWDVVTQAFTNLKIDIGPFHIRSTGVTIDLPRLDAPANSSGYTVGRYGSVGGHAAGGWAGLHGPELSWLGEKGPEYVRKAGTGTGDEPSSGAPAIISLVVDGRELGRVIDDRLYFRAQTAPR